MKFVLNILGANKGGDEVLSELDNDEVSIKSKSSSSESPPLATLFYLGEEIDLQLVDVRFGEKNIVITSFVLKGDKGGRAVFSLTPTFYENSNQKHI